MTDRVTERDVLDRLRQCLEAHARFEQEDTLVIVAVETCQAAILEIENLRADTGNDATRTIVHRGIIAELQQEIARRDLTIDLMMRDLDALQELIARPRG